MTAAELAGRQKAFDAALALAKSKGEFPGRPLRLRRHEAGRGARAVYGVGPSVC